MDYRYVGTSGLKVSELCLGTMNFGREADRDAAAEIVNAALDGGINFFDTANSYTSGESERLLGDLLHERRHDVVIATKFGNRVGTGPNDGGASRAHILRAVEDSLRRLRTDYLDVYYVHHIDPRTPAEETLSALDSLVRAGKVRYLGASNFEAWRLLESIWVSQVNHLSRYVIYQPQYSLLVRDVEEEILPVCQMKGLGVVPWAPLAGGVLSGKYHGVEGVVPGTRQAEERFGRGNNYLTPERDQIVAALVELAGELGHSPAPIALRWLLDNPLVPSVIIGARNADQVRANLHACGWRLPATARRTLSDLSRPAPRYPRDFEAGRT